VKSAGTNTRGKEKQVRVISPPSGEPVASALPPPILERRVECALSLVTSLATVTDTKHHHVAVARMLLG